MTTFRKIGAFALTAILCFGAFSCNKDDDEPEDIIGTGTGQSSQLGMNYAYFWTDEETVTSPDNHTMHLEFYNWDVVKFAQTEDYSLLPSKLNYVSFNYEVPKGQTAPKTVTLPSEKYYVMLVKDVPQGDADTGWQGESGYGVSGNSELKVIVDGYNIKLECARVTLHNIKNSSDTNIFNFSYSGPFAALAAGMRE